MASCLYVYIYIYLYIYIYQAVKMAALKGTVLERLKSSLLLFPPSFIWTKFDKHVLIE